MTPRLRCDERRVSGRPLERRGRGGARSEMVEQPGHVGEVDPAVAVVVEGRHWLVAGDPGHLVEIEDDIGEVGPSVAVHVVVEAVGVGVRRGPGTAPWSVIAKARSPVTPRINWQHPLPPGPGCRPGRDPPPPRPGQRSCDIARQILMRSSANFRV